MTEIIQVLVFNQSFLWNDEIKGYKKEYRIHTIVDFFTFTFAYLYGSILKLSSRTVYHTLGEEASLFQCFFPATLSL